MKVRVQLKRNSREDSSPLPTSQAPYPDIHDRDDVVQRLNERTPDHNGNKHNECSYES